MLNSISKAKNLSLYCVMLAVLFVFPAAALAQSGGGLNLPVADAGEDVNMFFGKTADLHGTATDSNGDPVLFPTWSWTVDVKPAGSTPFLSDPLVQNPQFPSKTTILKAAHKYIRIY